MDNKLIIGVVLLLLIFAISNGADVPVPVGGTLYNGDTLAVPDSVRLYVTDSLSLDESLLLGWGTSTWDTVIYVDVNGYWVNLKYKFWIVNDSVEEFERYDLYSVSGENSWTLTAYDSINSSAITGASFTIKNSAGTNIIGGGTTDENGELNINLPDGSYKVVPFSYNYTFSGSHTFSITGDEIDTVKAGPLNVAEPTLEATCSVHGYISRAPSASKSGIRVKAFINRRNVYLTRTNVAVSPYPVEDTTDADGYWMLPLYMSDSLTPNTPWRLQILDSLGEPTHMKSLYVPDSSQHYFTW